MDEDTANVLLEDMDFDKSGKMRCPKIEQMLLKLMKMVEWEVNSFFSWETDEHSDYYEWAQYYQLSQHTEQLVIRLIYEIETIY